jgi:threonyl-tRNA synthetase
MSATFTELHRRKHLLAHVLVAAGARVWPRVLLGRSGETASGFFADFGIPTDPHPDDVEKLTDEMARLISETKVFHEERLSPVAALEKFSDQPWKRHQISALAEFNPHIRLSNLDGVVDVCDCALKGPQSLRALHPEKFLLTDIEPVNWEFRGKTHRFSRVSGELFPAVQACDCCRPD